MRSNSQCTHLDSQQYEGCFNPQPHVTIKCAAGSEIFSSNYKTVNRRYKGDEEDKASAIQHLLATARMRQGVKVQAPLKRRPRNDYNSCSKMMTCKLYRFHKALKGFGKPGVREVRRDINDPYL